MEDQHSSPRARPIKYRHSFQTSGTTSRSKASKLEPTLTKKTSSDDELDDSLAGAKKKSHFIGRARKTLPNIFFNLRRQSSKSGKMSNSKKSGEYQHQIVKPTKSDNSSHAMAIRNQKESAANCDVDDVRFRASDITVTTTRASLESVETLPNLKHLKQKQESRSRRSPDTSDKLEVFSDHFSPVKSKPRKASCQLMIPVSDEVAIANQIAASGKSRRATSFSCAGKREYLEIDQRRRPWTFFNRLFSDKHKIKRSVSAKSKTSNNSDLPSPFKSNSIQRSNSPTELAVISATNTVFNVSNFSSTDELGSNSQMALAIWSSRCSVRKPEPKNSSVSVASDPLRKSQNQSSLDTNGSRMSESMQMLPPIAVLDTDDAMELSSEAKSSSEPSETQPAAVDCSRSSAKTTNNESRKVSIAAKIKRGSFRMSKRWNQRTPSDMNADDVANQNTQQSNSSTPQRPKPVVSGVIDLSDSSKVVSIPVSLIPSDMAMNKDSTLDVTTEKSLSGSTRTSVFDRANSSTDCKSPPAAMKDSLLPPEQYFTMQKSRKANSCTNFQANPHSEENMPIFFHRTNSMGKRPSDSVVLPHFPGEAKEKSAFEKLTNDLKRSFGGRKNAKGGMNSAESSSCSMYSPPTTEKSGLQMDVKERDGNFSSKDEETLGAPKRDSVWALTATSSIRRKSFRRPSQYDKPMRQKRFTNSVRECRTQGHHKADAEKTKFISGEVAISRPDEAQVLNERGVDPSRSYSSQEKVRFIILTLLDTERSYVSSLHYLVWVCLKPLQNRTEICEEHLLHYMLFKFPQILALHRQLLERLEALAGENSSEDREPESLPIGRLLLDIFSKTDLRQAYSEFIYKFNRTMEAKAICMSKTSFQKYIEVCQRQHNVKLTLDDLMIKPVQRIPRYLLLIKDLLGEIQTDCQDRQDLLEAQEVIRSLAILMNEQDSTKLKDMPTNESLLQELEHVVDGLNSFLKSHDRRLIRHDFVTEMKNMLVKKNRILLLFNDAVMCLASKTKRSSSRRGSTFSSVSGIDPFLRYRVCWKCLIRDCDIVQTSNVKQDKLAIQKFEQDLSKLNEIIALADTLYLPNDSLLAQARKTHSEISRQLQELKSFYSVDVTSARIQIVIDTPAGIESVIVVFQNSLIRSQWESVFVELKMKAGPSGQLVVPEFIKSIPLSLDAEIDDLRDKFKVLTANDGQFVFIVASYDTYSIIVQLQNIHQNNPVLNRVYYTDGIINDALVITQTPGFFNPDLIQTSTGQDGLNENSRSHVGIAMSGLVSPPPMQSLAAVSAASALGTSPSDAGRQLANSQSWCGDTNKFNSTNPNMLQLPPQLNPRISVMSFDSDSSEGEDFITYEHYSPRHRRLARESHSVGGIYISGGGGRRSSNVNGTPGHEGFVNSEKMSGAVSTGNTNINNEQPPFQKFNFNRNHSSAYSTEESTDIADCSLDESFTQSFSGSSIEEEAPTAMNFFLCICTADGKIKTLGALDDGEYFNLEEAFSYTIKEVPANEESTTRSDGVPQCEKETKVSAEVICLCSGVNKVFGGRSDGVIMSFDRTSGISLNVSESCRVSSVAIKCIVVAGDKLIAASGDNIIVLYVHSFLELKRVQIVEKNSPGSFAMISSIIRRNTFLIVICEYNPTVHFFSVLDFSPSGTLNLTSAQLDDGSFNLGCLTS